MAEITEIRIRKMEGPGNVKAYVTVTLDNSYAVHGLKVMEGQKGLWVSMPASKDKRGSFRDTFHPITKEARDILMKAVLEKYGKTAGEAPSTSREGESNTGESSQEEKLDDKPEGGEDTGE